MSVPRNIGPTPIAQPKPRTLSRSIASPHAQVGSPNPIASSIPNIPPRGSISSPSGALRSPSNAKSPVPISSDVNKPRAKPSSESLGPKRALSPPSTGASALTAALGRSPGTSAIGEESTSGSPAAPPFNRTHSGASTPHAGESSFSNLADIPDEKKAQVLRRHLVSAEERTGKSNSGTPGDDSPAKDGESGIVAGPSRDGPGDSAVTYGSTGTTEDPVDDNSFPIPYDAPGGDVTHDLYKWQHDHRPQPGRSASFSHIPLDRSTILDPTLAHIKEPGGFRRNFISTKAQEQGVEAPTMMRNVVDFLFVYGHFAGEDLDEDDDDDDDEEEEEEEGDGTAESAEQGRAAYNRMPSSRSIRAGDQERAPLLGQTGRGMSKTRHRRTKSGPPVGTASVTQATLMLLKGFVGTGILFMAKAFYNGGLLFSIVVMLSIAGLSLWSFLLLTQAWMVVPGSFGDIGGALYGRYMRFAILLSITVSQIGFVCAYIIFIAQNLQAFVLAITECRTFIPISYMIAAELILFLPIAMIRNLAKLSGTALIADAFILVGLVYISAQEISLISTQGIADVAMFNPTNFPLLIGTAVFAFEGVGLVIPITESMKEPKKFPAVLSMVMGVVAVLFGGAGALGYLTYGSDIQTVVIVNLPQDRKFVQVVQFLYSIAILLSIPLQLFPAVRIMENGLFQKSGKHNPRVKWQKNLFRAGAVLFCSLLSWASSGALDKFVSLIGSFACVPLCFIYPALLHLKACAKTPMEKAIDITFIVFGSAVGVFTTVQTIRSLAIPSEAPRFGNCEVPTGY